ncbi:retrovirus-related pol polyprotein from transposon TNT 1-94 [Tanacetum coccineum]
MDEGTKNYSFAHIPAVSNPSVLVDKTKSGGNRLKTTHTTSGANEESRTDDISQKVKLEDLLDILRDTRSAFFTPDPLTDKPIIVLDESEEEEDAKKDNDTEDTLSQKEELEQAKAKAKAEVASMKSKPSYPDINQLTELLVTSLKRKLSKLLASHDFASCLPTELKELPSKITGLSREIIELKKHVAELKNIKWELPAEFLTLQSQVSLVQEKLKILDSLLSLWHKVTDTLTRFATMVKNASGATSINVPLAGKATTSPAEREKNTKDADTNLKDELVDLLGKNVVTQYYTKKLLFDKYYDKMLKRTKSSKIIKCKVLTKKGPITLKIYREDGSDEVISNLKTRLDQLTQTEQELKIGLNKPLKEQDPLNELNELANKKRKRTSDLKTIPGNTRDLGSFGEETDEIKDLHQILKEVLLTARGDGVTGITRCRHDPSGDGVRDFVMALRRNNVDPNQHHKDFLKLVDSLDLDGENRERTRLRLFQFSLRDQASNWLERLPAGSITTWEDLTTRFLAQLFPSGRTAKLRNDIQMFQQHHGESLSEAWTCFKDLLQKVPHHGIDLWL